MNRQLFDWKHVDVKCCSCGAENVVQGDGKGENGNMVRIHVCQSCGHGVKIELQPKMQYKAFFNGKLATMQAIGPIEGWSDTPELAVESYRLALELKLIELEQAVKNTQAQLDSIPKSVHKIRILKT